jgi:hypothetical protein
MWVNTVDTLGREVVMTYVNEVKVGALLYMVGRSSVSALWIAPDGCHRWELWIAAWWPGNRPRDVGYE